MIHHIASSSSAILKIRRAPHQRGFFCLVPGAHCRLTSVKTRKESFMSCIHRKRLLLNLVSVTALVLLTSANTAAQVDAASIKTMEVRARGLYEVKTKQFGSEERAMIEVHLISAGEPVEGFQVSLFRTEDLKHVSTLRSDRHGMIRFFPLNPNKYTLILRRSLRMRRDTTIAIGDFFIKPFRPQDALKSSS